MTWNNRNNKERGVHEAALFQVFNGMAVGKNQLSRSGLRLRR